MTAQTRHLAALPLEEPSWLFGGGRAKAEALEAAADFLRCRDDEEDLGLFVLAYGFGMRLGAVAQTLRLDPSVVVWRLKRALSEWAREHPDGPGADDLEAGLVGLFRNGAELAPPPGHSSWRARDLIAELDADVRQRLADRLLPEGDGAPPRPGVGVGSIVLVLLAVLGFMFVGLIRDQDPYTRGRDLMEQGRFAAARDAFVQCGDRPDALKEIAISWLAEGEFEKAFLLIDREEVAEQFGLFRPRDRGMIPVDVDADSAALLPRGSILDRRPTFVYATGGPAELSFSVGVGYETRTVTRPLPDSSGADAWAELPWPEEWPSLNEGVIVWSITRDGEVSQASFTLLDKPTRQDLQKTCWRVLDRRVPVQVHDFLRGHLYANKGLYMNAAQQFASLARTFPAADYPRRTVTRLSRVLGVDPSVFLR